MKENNLQLGKGWRSYEHIERTKISDGDMLLSGALAGKALEGGLASNAGYWDRSDPHCGVCME